MFDKLSEPVQKFFGFLGASLTGITAVFTAAGFLAERARLTMLGLPSSTFDLQLYLETGARFLAFLPLYLGFALLYTVLRAPLTLFTWLENSFGLEAAAVIFLGVLVAAIVGIILIFRKHRNETETGSGRWIQRRAAAIKSWGTDHLALVLFIFLLIQFLGAYQLTQALEINNLLFDPHPEPVVTPYADLSFVSVRSLRGWIVDGHPINGMQYLGWLFLITLATVWGLYLMRDLFGTGGSKAEEDVAGSRPDRADVGFWRMTWFAGSLMLLLTQITLLPINYGVLLSGNNFAQVLVTFNPDVDESVKPPAVDLFLIHQSSGGFYFYSQAERNVWYVLRGDVRSIQYERMGSVFLSHPEMP